MLVCDFGDKRIPLLKGKNEALEGRKVQRERRKRGRGVGRRRESNSRLRKLPRVSNVRNCDINFNVVRNIFGIFSPSPCRNCTLISFSIVRHGAELNQQEQER